MSVPVSLSGSALAMSSGRAYSRVGSSAVGSSGVGANSGWATNFTGRPLPFPFVVRINPASGCFVLAHCITTINGPPPNSSVRGRASAQVRAPAQARSPAHAHRLGHHVVYENDVGGVDGLKPDVWQIRHRLAAGQEVVPFLKLAVPADDGGDIIFAAANQIGERGGGEAGVDVGGVSGRQREYAGFGLGLHGGHGVGYGDGSGGIDDDQVAVGEAGQDGVVAAIVGPVGDPALPLLALRQPDPDAGDDVVEGFDEGSGGGAGLSDVGEH